MSNTASEHLLNLASVLEREDGWRNSATLLRSVAAQLDALTAELKAAREGPDAARCGECGAVWLTSSKIVDLSELVEPHRQEAKALRAKLEAVARVRLGLERDAGNAVLGERMMGLREGRLDAAQRLSAALATDAAASPSPWTPSIDDFMIAAEYVIQQATGPQLDRLRALLEYVTKLPANLHRDDPERCERCGGTVQNPGRDKLCFGCVCDDEDAAIRAHEGGPPDGFDPLPWRADGHMVLDANNLIVCHARLGTAGFIAAYCNQVLEPERERARSDTKRPETTPNDPVERNS